MRRRWRKADGTRGRAFAGSGLRRKAVAIVLVVLCAGLVVTLAVQFYQGFTLSGPHRAEYEGRVVDKSLTISERQTGSGATHRLHVRGRDGLVFDVIVTAGLYERARVGMWIRSDRNGAEFYATEPPADAATKTEGAEPPSVSAPR